MARSSAAKIEQELLERVALLSPAQKREALDFVSFISTRRRSRLKETTQSRIKKPASSIEAIFDLASDCTDIDLSVNHDKYLYGDDQL